MEGIRLSPVRSRASSHGPVMSIDSESRGPDELQQNNELTDDNEYRRRQLQRQELIQVKEKESFKKSKRRLSSFSLSFLQHIPRPSPSQRPKKDQDNQNELKP